MLAMLRLAVKALGAAVMALPEEDRAKGYREPLEVPQPAPRLAKVGD